MDINEQGRVVVVFAIIFTCCSTASSILRIYVSVNQKLAFRADDGLCFTALALIIAQTVALKCAESNGLGKPMSTLSSDEISNFFKSIYVSHLLGLALATTFSKASVTALFKRILAIWLNRISYSILLVMITAWGIFSVFALAFQCKFPEPWRFVPSNCPTKGRIFYPVIVLNIVTDFVLALYIIPEIFSLSLKKSDRWIVAGLFGSRILVCIASIFQLILTVQTLDEPDQTRYLVKSIILESAVVNLSLITATLPRIHCYLAGLQAGLLSTQIREEEVHHYRRQLAMVNSAP